MIQRMYARIRIGRRAAVPEVFTDKFHPNGASLKAILWTNFADTLKRQIMIDQVETAAEFWSWVEAEVVDASCESFHILQQRLFNSSLGRDDIAYLLKSYCILCDVISSQGGVEQALLLFKSSLGKDYIAEYAVRLQ